MKRILAIVQHRKGRSPGQRFRFEHFISTLEANGYEIVFSNIINEKDDEVFYSHGHYFAKLIIVIKSLIHRFRDIKTAKTCDLIFIYREAFMLGSTYFEKRLAKTGVPIVFDFDDSIWLNDTSDGNKNLSWLKKPEKTSEICSIASIVTVGNEYLANYAAQYNKKVFVLPTTINTNYHKQSANNKKGESICIGWTGTTTTLKHYEEAIPVLLRLKEKYQNKIYFKVIVNSEIWNREIDVKLVKWSGENEIEELSEFDIGIMPLPNDEWSRGKCGFKGLQCMALGIPVIMSPVGVNNQIIVSGQNGFLAEDENQWFDTLCNLIENAELRQKTGEAGRKTVEKKYSVNVWNEKVLDLFNKLTGKAED
jgi:glycosyltransferase involved in cell wall biosynthesis